MSDQVEHFIVFLVADSYYVLLKVFRVTSANVFVINLSRRLPQSARFLIRPISDNYTIM